MQQMTCEHGKIKRACTECTPSLNCIHKIRKTNCRICSPPCTNSLRVWAKLHRFGSPKKIELQRLDISQ